MTQLMDSSSRASKADSLQATTVSGLQSPGLLQDGVHYHFTSKPQMEKEIADGQFLEYAHVHGNIYGTSVAAVREVAANGKCCILDIDVQGARQVCAAGNHVPCWLRTTSVSLFTAWYLASRAVLVAEHTARRHQHQGPTLSVETAVKDQHDSWTSRAGVIKLTSS